MEKIDLKQFIDKIQHEEYGIENILLENEVLDDSNLTCFLMKNCTFKNVVFKNHNGSLWIDYENCSFYDCTFENIVSEEFYISTRENYYFNCKFKNIHIEGFTEQSGIGEGKIENCIFEDIKIEADMSSGCYLIEKSIFNNVYYHVLDFENNDIIDSKIKNTKFECDYISYNNFQNVEFDEFKIECIKDYMHTNTFVDCDKEKVEITIWGY